MLAVWHTATWTARSRLKNSIINKLCAWWHDMPPPLSSPVGAPAPRVPPSRRNIAVVSHTQYVLTGTAAPASRVKAALSKAPWWPLTFDLESGVRVVCDVGYLCANSGLPRPVCSRLRPDVRDRQTETLLVGRQGRAFGLQKLGVGSLVVTIWLEFCTCLIAPVVTTTIILSSSKIQNGDILVPANPGPPGKWPLKRIEVHVTVACCVRL